MRLTAIQTACSILLLACGQIAAEELTREVVLTIAGKEHAIPDGGSIEVGGTSIRARISPRQTFTGKGYRVSLPGHFAFEKDDSMPSVMDYTFDGKNVVMSIYEVSDTMDAHGFAGTIPEIMKETLSVKSLKKRKADPLVLEGDSIPGDLVIMNVAGVEIRMSLYVVDRAGGKSVLTLQSGIDQADIDELAELKAALTNTYRKHP